MNHKTRVQAELIKAGMTKYGLLKGESRHLPSIIHPREKIGGVVYGRYKNGSGMMVATAKRLIFLDHKPLFRLTEDISYFVLSGVSINTQGRFAGIVIHTKLGDYSIRIRFVNVKAAKNFVQFVEKRQLEQDKNPLLPNANKLGRTTPRSVTLDKRTKDFLESHEIAVLSSVDNKGNVQGATIYYALDAQNNFYFVTKSGTDKAQNILLNPQVALTIFDADTLQTAQIQGITQLEANPVIFEAITKNIFKLRKYGTDFGWPPLTKIISGQYVIFKIVPTSLKFSSYKD